MKKIIAFLLIGTGILLIIISIMALVRAFDIFITIGKDNDSLGYVFGSIVFPLLLTVFGRWMFRQGTKKLRQSQQRH